MRNLPQSEMIESCSVPTSGYVNVTLSNKWMANVRACLQLFLLFVWKNKNNCFVYSFFFVGWSKGPSLLLLINS
jgi:hypothetical protein